MCGSVRSSPTNRLNASGLLHSAEKSDWLSLADELADLSEPNFEKVILAFRLIRKAVDFERSQKPAPRRRSLR